MRRCFLLRGSWVDFVSYTRGMLPFVSPRSIMIFQRPATTAPAWPICSYLLLLTTITTIAATTATTTSTTIATDSLS